MAGRDAGRGPGWLLTLVGASLLVLLGFALGLVVGASWEDPDLLASQLAGRTAEVPLPGPAPEGAPPAVAAAPDPGPLGGLDAPSGAREAPAAAPLGGRGDAAPAAPPPVASPPPAPSGHFAVQVGAFREPDPAQGLVGRLAERGFRAYVARSGEGGAQRWRVRVGPVDTRGEADDLARRLKRDEGLPTWVVSDDG